MIIIIIAIAVNLVITSLVIWLLPVKKSQNDWTCTAHGDRCKSQCLDCYLYEDGGYKKEPF